MLFYVLGVFSVVIFELSSNAESKLPLNTCKRNSNNYTPCFIRFFEEAWPQIVAGLPEFNIPPLDPLFYKYSKFEFVHDNIRAEAIVSNLSVIGLSKAHFPNIRTHFLDDVFRLEIDVQVSKLFIEAIVKINGSLNGLPINSKGHANATMNDVNGTCDFTGHIVNDTWIIEHVRLAPTIGKLKVNFDNLSEGNKELSDIAVTFINEYWPILYRQVLPIMSDLLDPLLSAFANRYYSKVSFSKIFP